MLIRTSTVKASFVFDFTLSIHNSHVGKMFCKLPGGDIFLLSHHVRDNHISDPFGCVADVKLCDGAAPYTLNLSLT